jgi:hypothetical protein
VSRCKTQGCETFIDWAETREGARMPVDHDSAGKPGGNLAVWRDRGRLLCRDLRPGEEPAAGEKWGVNHWGTCVNAEEHRAAAGWSHSARHFRWEWRRTRGGPPDAWWHDRAIIDDPAAVMAAVADRGLPPLPVEARPPVQQDALDLEQP